MAQHDKDALMKELAGSLPIETGVGDPASRYYKQLLSEEEEKRLGTDDEPIAEGKLWSKSATGLYLTIGVAGPGTEFTGMIDWSSYADTGLPGKRHAVVFSSAGKPTVHKGVMVGASMELPDDLGQDPAKRQYIIEWITNTFLEAAELSGLQINPEDKAKREGAFNWLAVAAEQAIRRTGL